MARFLVVDDDASVVAALSTLLRDDGHEVAPFVEGALAVEALARDTFDAVVTDFDMPHVDGRAVVRVTGDLQAAACMVLVTAKPHEARRVLPIADYCRVMDKPLDYEALTELVTRCMACGGRERNGKCPMKGT